MQTTSLQFTREQERLIVRSTEDWIVDYEKNFHLGHFNRTFHSVRRRRFMVARRRSRRNRDHLDGRLLNPSDGSTLPDRQP
jgi:hypothetical protein